MAQQPYGEHVVEPRMPATTKILGYEIRCDTEIRPQIRRLYHPLSAYSIPPNSAPPPTKNQPYPDAEPGEPDERICHPSGKSAWIKHPSRMMRLKHVIYGKGPIR